MYRKNDKRISDVGFDVLGEVTSEINSGNLSKVTCGLCGSIGQLVFFCTYMRNITYIEDDNVKTYVLRLIRYKCTLCKRTHVMISGTQMIPYGRYTLGFILYVLCEYIRRKYTVRQIAEKYQISVSTLYAWRDRFNEHYELLKGKLEASERNSSESISDIYDNLQISVMLYQYADKFKFGFMQNNKKDNTSHKFILSGYLIILTRGSP